MKIRLMHPAVGEIAFPLRRGGSLVIGRLGNMTDVEISWDQRISRRHCRLWEKDGRVWFQDLNSRNGSWIGSDRVEGVHRLEPGSSVLIGETVLLLPDWKQNAQADRVVEETHEREASAEELARLNNLPPPPQAVPAAAQPVVNTLAPPPVPQSQITAIPRSAPVGVAGIPGAVTQALRTPSSLMAVGGGVATSNGVNFELPIEAPVEGGGATMDLRRTQDVFKKPPPPQPAGPIRAAPRFVSTARVQVSISGRDALRDLWTKDISKGGLFVETAQPPPQGSIVEVALQTPNGTIKLQGNVVHVIDAASAQSYGGSPGVGLQFTNLDDDTRRSIRSYLDGLAGEFRQNYAEAPVLSPQESDEVLARAKKFMEDAQAYDFYTALDIWPTAPQDKVTESVDELQRKFSEASHRLAPPQAARVKAALSILTRIRRILLNPDGRLDYDFRKGHVRSMERIQAANAGTGPALSALRQAWNRVFPERVDQAALLTRRAFAARQRQDLAEAINAGRAALDLNPFFEELKQTVSAWEASMSRPAE